MKKSTHKLSRQTAIVFAVLSLIMTAVFANTFFTHRPIEKAAAEEKSAVFSCYEAEYGPNLRRTVNTLNHITLFFESGEKEYIGGECVNAELTQALKALENGNRLYMLINPNNGHIVELKANGEEILNFDYAQKKLRQEGIGFLGLSGFLLVLCGYFVYAAITTKERITKADLKFYWDIVRKK